MSKNKQSKAKMNETDELKNKLVTLVQEIIPEIPTPEEITVFMKTKTIPSTWFAELFNRDVSPEKFGEIRNLMDFILDDLSKPTGNKRQKDSEDAPGQKINAPGPALVAKPDANSLLTGSSIKNNSGPILTIVEKSTDKPKEMPPNPTGQRSKKRPRSGTRRWGNFPKKENLSEQELAEKLLLKFVDSAFSGKNTLDLSELQTLVSQNLIEHTISYDYQEKVLTLRNDVGSAVATFCAEKVKVVLA